MVDKTPSLTVCISFLALLVLALLLLAQNTGAEENDPLEYSFEETGEDEESGRGKDYVEYELEGLQDHTIEPQLKVENLGDETVNFSFAAFQETDLDPNPNDEDEKKIEPRWVSGEWELDAGRSRIFGLDIICSENLISYEEPYVLSLHFRNEDQKISHDMEVKIFVLPVYALELEDEFGDSDRDIDAGDTLDFNLLLRNVGNAYDDVELDVKVEGDGMTATITKPDSGVYEDIAPEIQGLKEQHPVNVKFNSDEQVEEGLYYLTVKATSLNDEDSKASVEYEIEITVKVPPPPPPGDPPIEEGSIPLWVWFGIIGLIGAGGGGSTWILLKGGDEDEDDEDWVDDEDWNYRGGEDQREEPPAPVYNMPREMPAPPRSVTAPRPRPGEAARVKCPRCRTPFRVGSQKRPLKVKCPGCLSPVTLKGKARQSPQRQEAPSSAGKAGPARVGCPKCQAKFKVKNPKRPLKVKCPGCESLITLKGKKEAGHPAQPSQREARQAKGPAKIRCPGCQVHFKVRNPKRPLKVKCPGCEKVLTLK